MFARFEIQISQIQNIAQTTNSTNNNNWNIPVNQKKKEQQYHHFREQKQKQKFVQKLSSQYAVLAVSCIGIGRNHKKKSKKNWIMDDIHSVGNTSSTDEPIIK